MAVAFLNTNTMTAAVASPASSSKTVNATGTNRCAFIPILYDDAGTMSVTAVTYGGQACSSVGTASHSPTSNEYAECWYLVNPPTGSNTLSITVSGTIRDIYYGLVAFTGVNQTTPIRSGTYFNHTTNAVTDGSGNYALTISRNANDLTLTCVNGGGSGNVTTTQTRDGFSTAGGMSAAHDHGPASGASVTHTWSGGGAGSELAIVGFAINGDPAGGGGGVTYPELERVTRGLHRGLSYTRHSIDRLARAEVERLERLGARAA